MAQQYLYANNGDGTFSDVTLFAGAGYDEHGVVLSGMGADFADYDNDGDLDLIVSNAQKQPAVLFQNEGDGTFSDATYPSGIGQRTLSYFKWAVAFLDYDNDGFQDLFISNGHLQENIHLFYPTIRYPQRNLLFHNRGDATFEEVSQYSGEALSQVKVSRAATFGDYDNDGDVDIFISHSNQTANLWRNDGGNRHHWLTIRTVGIHSNRDGIGTRIKVITDFLTQTKEVTANAGYLSARDKRLHFGLGKHTRADLIIRWPSGLVEQLRDVEADQNLTVMEGKSSVTTP